MNPVDPNDEFQLSAYRDRTVAMLRRYARAAIELGRLPSLLGREFFRAKVTSYTVHTFEDAIIFAFDMERSFEKLSPIERSLLGRIVIQEYSRDEVARRMRIAHSSLVERYLNAVDHLTEILLDNGLLNPSILQPRYRRRPVVPISSQPQSAAPADPAPPTPDAIRPGSTFDLNACQAPKNGDFAASA
jgi:hypothetical protein